MKLIEVSGEGGGSDAHCRISKSRKVRVFICTVWGALMRGARMEGREKIHVHNKLRFLVRGP